MCYQSAVQLSSEDLAGEIARGAERKTNRHSWPHLFELCEDAREPACGGAFHRAHAQRSAWCRKLHRLAGFEGERQEPTGIAVETLALGRQRHLFAIATEKGDTKIFFKLLDSRRHIGRRATNSGCRPGHASISGNSEKYLK
jgi:hypothetical protein